jgi:hypothetical protein
MAKKIVFFHADKHMKPPKPFSEAVKKSVGGGVIRLRGYSKSLSARIKHMI